jgi:hypothetical protein
MAFSNCGGFARAARNVRRDELIEAAEGPRAYRDSAHRHTGRSDPGILDHRSGGTGSFSVTRIQSLTISQAVAFTLSSAISLQTRTVPLELRAAVTSTRLRCRVPQSHNGRRASISVSPNVVIV